MKNLESRISTKIISSNKGRDIEGNTQAEIEILRRSLHKLESKNRVTNNTPNISRNYDASEYYVGWDTEQYRGTYQG